MRSLIILSIEFKQSNCECKSVRIKDHQLEGICVCDQLVILTHSKIMPALQEHWQPKPAQEKAADSASKKNKYSKLQLRTNGLALPPGMIS